jgi:hypothetical protein
VGRRGTWGRWGDALGLGTVEVSGSRGLPLAPRGGPPHRGPPPRGGARGRASARLGGGGRASGRRARGMCVARARVRTGHTKGLPARRRPRSRQARQAGGCPAASAGVLLPGRRRRTMRGVGRPRALDGSGSPAGLARPFASRGTNPNPRNRAGADPGRDGPGGARRRHGASGSRAAWGPGSCAGSCAAPGQGSAGGRVGVGRRRRGRGAWEPWEPWEPREPCAPSAPCVRGVPSVRWAPCLRWVPWVRWVPCVRLARGARGLRGSRVGAHALEG